MVTHGFECGSARRLAPGVFFAVRRSPFDIRRTSTARAHRRAQEKTACDIRKPFSMPADRSRARIADSAGRVAASGGLSRRAAVRRRQARRELLRIARRRRTANDVERIARDPRDVERREALAINRRRIAHDDAQTRRRDRVERRDVRRAAEHREPARRFRIERPACVPAAVAVAATGAAGAAVAEDDAAPLPSVARISSAMRSASGPMITCTLLPPRLSTPRAPIVRRSASDTFSGSTTERRSRVVHASTTDRFAAPPSAAM